MDPAKFQELLMLPLPLLDDTKEHYRPFTELYSCQPSEQDCPSLQPSGDSDAIDANAKHKMLFNSSKVRSSLHCQECFKPKCVYAARKHGLNEKVLVDTVNEVKTYTCGSALFLQSSALVDTVFLDRTLDVLIPSGPNIQCC